MTESPISAQPPHGAEEQQQEKQQDHQKEDKMALKRVCDFCGETRALLYCRADSAKLCLCCDREVHSTNQLFTKHTRSLLCDACDSSPASIFCSTDSSVLCQNCDWEIHNLSLSSLHVRRPLEGFTGCPSFTELLAFLGFDDLDKKSLFGGSAPSDWSVDYGSNTTDELSDLLVWDTPSFATLDDLILSNNSAHSFQAMGVPPLPKNRNAACGRHKEEMLRQLKEMAKSEPNFDDCQEDIAPLVGFKPLEHTRVPSYEANAFKGCRDTVDAADQGVPSNLAGNYVERNHLVPDKDSDTGDNLSHASCLHEGQAPSPLSPKIVQVIPTFASRELNSQERDSAISRYKEKKKTRRYDKLIRYESRRVRAESRTRIRGRFAKMDQ